MVSITIKTLQQKQFKVEAESTDTVADLKSKIEQSQGHPVSNQKLVYSGKILQDERTVAECNIKEKDFLVLMVSKPKAASTSTAAAATSTTPAASSSAAVATDNTVPPPAPIPAPSEPAQTTTSSGSDATPAATSTANVPAFGDLSSFVTGSALQSSIDNMVEMGFPKEQVMKALKASFNNPDRAVEYLMNGIPEHLLAEGPGPSAATPTSAAPAPAPAQVPVPAAQPAATATGGTPGQGNVTVVDSTPQNLFQAAAQQASGRGAAGGGAGGGAPHLDLSALRNSPMFGQIQQMVQQNPALLQPLIQQLAATQPGLAQAINQHPEILYDLLAGVAGGEGGGDDGEGGPIPPGAHVISVTEEERAAIERLEALGFPRQQVIEAYFACGKNEELAANFLFEGGFNDD